MKLILRRCIVSLVILATMATLAAPLAHAAKKGSKSPDGNVDPERGSDSKGAPSYGNGERGNRGNNESGGRAYPDGDYGGSGEFGGGSNNDPLFRTAKDFDREVLLLRDVTREEDTLRSQLNSKAYLTAAATTVAAGGILYWGSRLVAGHPYVAGTLALVGVSNGAHAEESSFDGYYANNPEKLITGQMTDNEALYWAHYSKEINDGLRQAITYAREQMCQSEAKTAKVEAFCSL